jgi:hypothetical protein
MNGGRVKLEKEQNKERDYGERAKRREEKGVIWKEVRSRKA